MWNTQYLPSISQITNVSVLDNWGLWNYVYTEYINIDCFHELTYIISILIL